jgi:RNA polymerase sigma factor (sigma-70 family)
MAAGLPQLIKRLRITMSGERLAGAKDGELLDAFVGDRDEGAFAELVRRHGPTVLAECRRILGDQTDSEDAFQATFLVLVRKARTIRDPDRLGGWLRGVAVRVARRARVRAARRSAVERPLVAAGDPATQVPTPPATDIKVILTEELNRLPRHYRDAIAACDVDGLTRRAAAERLGIPDGTLSNRLARARALLGRRLLRRGVALGAGLAISPSAAATVSDRLLVRTVILGTDGPVPEQIASLIVEAMKPMIPIRTLVSVATVIVVLGSFLVLVPNHRPVYAAPTLRPPADLPDPPDPKPVRGEMVYAVRHSRDGRYLALAQPKAYDGKGSHKVILYDCRTWKELFRLTGPTEICHSVEFSPDGRTLFAASRDGNVYTWDTATGKSGPHLTTNDLLCVAVLGSPDGKYLITGHAEWEKEPRTTHIRVWDSNTRKMLHKIESDDALLVSTLAFAPDGKHFASGYNKDAPTPKDFCGVIEWDAATGKEHRRYDAVRITAGALPVTHSIVYTPDGKWLIVGGGEAVPVPGAVGKRTTLRGYLWVFDRTTGKLEKTLLEERNDYVREIRLSPDGTRLYATSTTDRREILRDGNRSTVTFNELPCWDTSDWTRKWSHELDDAVAFNNLDVAPTGKRLVLTTNKGVFLLDAKTGESRGSLVEVPQN